MGYSWDLSELISTLKLVGYHGSMSKPEQFEKAVQDGARSTSFSDCICWLCSELQSICGLEETVHPLEESDDFGSFVMELSSFLKELDCPATYLTEGSLSQRFASKEDRLAALHFLCTELQAARILFTNNPQQSSRQSVSTAPTITESDTASDLRVACTSLGFPKPPDTITAPQLFSKMQERVKEQLSKMPSGALKNPLLHGALSSTQWDALEQVNRDMSAQYRTRAEMLLKRLDVTIESFSWSDRIKQKEQDLKKVFEPLRRKLRPDSRIHISDVLAAREDLVLVEKTSGMSVRQKTKSKLNKFLMGRVPDRGGRPTEIQAPPPEMPSWAQRTPQSGGGGARGGGGFGGSRVQRGGQSQQYQQGQYGGGGYQQRGGGQGFGGHYNNQQNSGGGNYEQGARGQHGYAGYGAYNTGGFQQQNSYGAYGGGHGGTYQQYGNSSNSAQYYQHDDRYGGNRGDSQRDRGDGRSGRGRGGGRGHYGRR